jgi:hypothetical protein
MTPDTSGYLPITQASICLVSERLIAAYKAAHIRRRLRQSDQRQQQADQHGRGNVFHIPLPRACAVRFQALENFPRDFPRPGKVGGDIFQCLENFQFPFPMLGKIRRASPVRPPTLHPNTQFNGYRAGLRNFAAEMN